MSQAGLVVPSATPCTRRRIGESLGVRAGSVPGGSHHEYLRALASAASKICGAQQVVDRYAALHLPQERDDLLVPKPRLLHVRFLSGKRTLLTLGWH